MRAINIAVAGALLLAGTAAHAQQTKLPGGPDTKQWVGDPMIKEPTADQLARGVKKKRDLGPTGGQLGGQPGEPQRGGNGNGG